MGTNKKKLPMENFGKNLGKKMDKPHHLMVYIMDKNHKPVLKGKVGFLFKDSEGNSQKAMDKFDYEIR